MKPDLDALGCAWGDCEDDARVATPGGPMCRPHANELARAERREA